MPLRKVTKVKVKVNGEEQEVDLYYINVLADALGRHVQTVRKWEISGVIPPALFKDSMGKRLYTEGQIQLIVQSAEDAHIKQGMSIANTSFSSKVHKRWKKYNERFK